MCLSVALSISLQAWVVIQEVHDMSSPLASGAIGDFPDMMAFIHAPVAGASSSKDSKDSKDSRAEAKEVLRRIP